jgi:hypothetical protein
MKLPVAAALGLGLFATSAGMALAENNCSYDQSASYNTAQAAPVNEAQAETAQPVHRYSTESSRTSEQPGWVAYTKPDHPPASIVGAMVVDYKGKPIGHVTGVSGDKVVVRYNDYLSMPEPTGVFPWQQLAPAYGNVDLLTTDLNKGQMEGLPPAPI